MAVLGVLVFHLASELLPGGFTGVDVFFVISGYVITGSLVGREPETFRHFLLGFYRRRVVRILPALLVFLVVFSLASVLFIPYSWLSTQNVWTALAAVWGAGNLALLRGEDGYFADRVHFNPFTHTWSLGVEEQFYLIYPLIFYFFLLNREERRIRGSLVLLALTALSLLIAVIQTADSPNAAFYLLPARFWQIATGAVLFQLLATMPSPLPDRLARAFAWSGFGLVVAGFVLARPGLIPFPMAVVTVLGASLLIAGLRQSGVNRSLVANALRHPASVYIGRVSYSLYLWHWGVIVLMRWTVGVDSPLLIAVAGVLSFALADASFRIVERPALRLAATSESTISRFALPGAALALVAASVCVVGLFGAQRRLGFGLSVTRDRSVWAPRGQLPVSRLGATVDTSRPALLVVGDSHAGWYSPLVDSVARRLQLGAAVFSVSGCPVASLLGPETTSGTCAGATREALE